MRKRGEGKQGDRTRRAIVEKSLQIFSVKGYFNASINDILRATALTKGGLYGHFGSKEDLWLAAYGRAVEIWRGIAFAGVREIPDPLERIKKTVDNHLRRYLGSGVFAGGCFFFNMLVELSGQSRPMTRRILKGVTEFSRLLASWLEEADRAGLLRPGLDVREVADFILISLNGASGIYAASRDPRILDETVRQLDAYIDRLKDTGSDRVSRRGAPPSAPTGRPPIAPTGGPCRRSPTTRRASATKPLRPWTTDVAPVGVTGGRSAAGGAVAPARTRHVRREGGS